MGHLFLGDLMSASKFSVTDEDRNKSRMRMNSQGGSGFGEHTLKSNVRACGDVFGKQRPLYVPTVN